jgi:hypothetical protein
MKSVVAILLCLCISLTVFAQNTITSRGSGEWELPSTWDKNRVPADNDIVVIQSGHEVQVSRKVSLRNPTLRVIGTLLIEPGVTMNFNTSSVINVISGGRIESAQSNAQTAIFIGTDAKFRGNKVFNQSWGAGKLLGLAYATATTGNLDQQGSGFVLGNPPSTWQDLRVFVTTEDLVQLIWVTSHETTSRSFRIQRSQNAQSWQEIGVIESSGNMSAQNIYSFVDNAPGSGVFYYRLLEYTSFGLYKVSDVKSARIKEKVFTEKIFPNPARGSAQMQFPALATSAQLRAFNLEGRLLHNRFLQKGTVGAQLDLSGWPAGTYIIQVSSEEGVLSQQRLVKY